MGDSVAPSSNIMFFPGCGPEDLITPVWEDSENGVRRVLEAALAAGLKNIAIVGGDQAGGLYVASTAASSEEAMGMFMRGAHKINQLSDERDERTDEANQRDDT